MFTVHENHCKVMDMINKNKNKKTTIRNPKELAKVSSWKVLGMIFSRLVCKRAVPGPGTWRRVQPWSRGCLSWGRPGPQGAGSPAAGSCGSAGHG